MEIKPISAPRCLGSAAIVRRVFGRGWKRIVERRLVLEGDRRDLGGHGEDDVEVWDRQQLGLAIGEPLGAGEALALGAMAIAAGVIGDAQMAAVGAVFGMATEGRGAARFDRAHDAPLATAESPACAWR